MSMIDATLRPIKVDRPSDATGMVDTGKLVSLFDQADATSVMRAVEQLAEQKLVRMNETQAVEDLMRCGYVETTYLVSTFGDPSILDPRLDPNIVGAANSIFTTNELGASTFQKTASVMKLVVNGFAGAGTIESGGYDYHDSTRASGERRDFEAGLAMGAALEYAARLGRQLMLYVFSDGSVNSTGELDNSVDGRGKGIWKADDSQTAAAFVLVYDPAGRPQLSRPGAGQIGWFRANGDLETGATRISNNVDRLAEAIVLNYLALHDEVGRLAQVLPAHGLGSTAEIDSLVAFAPIRAAGP
jgi:hypothetical protein